MIIIILLFAIFIMTHISIACDEAEHDRVSRGIRGINKK